MNQTLPGHYTKRTPFVLITFDIIHFPVALEEISLELLHRSIHLGCASKIFSLVPSLPVQLS